MDLYKAKRNLFSIVLNDDIFEQYNNIAIYGAGGHTKYLLEYIKELGYLNKIYCIIDNDESILIGQIKYNIHVYSLNDVLNDIDCIIISSDVFERIIYARIHYVEDLNIKIIRIYGNRESRTGEILFNKYNTDKECENEEIYLRKLEEQIVNKREAIEEYIENFYSCLKMPLFNHIEIETINRCNNVCSFCPINKNNDKRKYLKMDEDLFKNIINQLDELDYDGWLGLFSNNEPLLDSRIVHFSKYAKEKLPKAFICIFTNGILLNLEKFIALSKYIDLILVDNYNDNLELNSNIREIYEYCKNKPEYLNKVEIHLRKVNEILTSRGGNAPNRERKLKIDIKCILPFFQMIIRPDGKVSLCCNDALGQYTLGDLNKNKLIEIWKGDGYKSVRAKLRQGRNNISLCEYCDTLLL